MLNTPLNQLKPEYLAKPAHEPFFSLPENLLDSSVSQALLDRLERKVRPHLIPLARKINPDLIRNQKLNYAEALPKAMRVSTLRLDNPQAVRIWNDCDIESVVSPKTARHLCEKIFGVKLDPDHGKQVVCYGEGDYFSPHNDHHPEMPHMKNGYIDFHYYICNDSVEQQYLVREFRGHLNHMYSVARETGINIYKLPFWHYTTPLTAKKDAVKPAARWIIMYTFYFSENTFAHQTQIRPDKKTAPPIKSPSKNRGKVSQNRNKNKS